MRAALRELAGHNWHSAAFAVVIAVLMVAAVLALVALAGLVTVTVADERTGLQVAVFVVVTLATSGLLVFVGARPWMYTIEVLLWKREPPPGSVAVHLHVHEDDHERAPWVLLDAGFKYVEYSPSARPPPRAQFPTKCITAWRTPGGPDRHRDGTQHAYWALKGAGIRVNSIVGSCAFTR